MKELDLRVLWDLLLRNLRIIILFVSIVAVIFGGVTIVFQEDAYRSKCSMYVMNITQDSAGQTTGISAAGLDASQRMVDEFIAILRSDSVLYDVQQELKKLNYNYSVSNIKSMLSMTAVNETALLQITATTGDPNLSKAVCDAIQLCAPKKVREVMLGIGTITPVDVAKVGTRVQSTIVRNAVLGGVIGFILSYGIFLINYLLDNTIKDEKDLKAHFNVNVLGVVPNFHPHVDKKSSSDKKKPVKTEVKEAANNG